MMKLCFVFLFTISGLLMLNGLLNIMDNGKVLAYDISSILSGFGFILTGLVLRRLK